MLGISTPGLRQEFSSIVRALRWATDCVDAAHYCGDELRLDSGPTIRREINQIFQDDTRRCEDLDFADQVLNLGSEFKNKFHVRLGQHVDRLQTASLWSLTSLLVSASQLRHCLAAVKFLRQSPEIHGEAVAVSTPQRQRGESLYFLSKHPLPSWNKRYGKSLPLEKTGLFLLIFEHPVKTF